MRKSTVKYVNFILVKLLSDSGQFNVHCFMSSDSNFYCTYELEIKFSHCVYQCKQFEVNLANLQLA